LIRKNKNLLVMPFNTT